MAKKHRIETGEPSKADLLQDQIIAGANKSLSEGRDAFIYGPTGCGKSRMFSEVAADRVADGERVIVLSHRKSLVRNGQESMEDWVKQPIATTIGMNGQIDQSGDVVYSTVQTAHELRDQLDVYHTAIVDEAHHGTEKNSDYIQTMEALIAKNPNIKFVPATATPPENYEGMFHRFQTADRHMISFEEAVEAKLVRLPETKCPAMVYDQPERIEDIVRKHRKDDKSAAMLGGIKKAVAQLRGSDMESWAHQEVNQYQLHLEDRRTLAYFDSIKEADAFVGEALSRGIPIAAIHSKQNTRENEALRQAFEDRRLKGLVSVDMISEGYDIDCNGILLSKKTTSATEYKQIIGRGSRGRGEDGEPTLLIDLGASTYIHGNISTQAQLQTMRVNIERDTLTPDRLLPDAGATGFNPWIEVKSPKSNKTVWGTSIDDKIVYAAPSGDGYVALASTQGKKGAAIGLLVIEGELKGRPTREGLGDWMADAMQRSERNFARLGGNQRDGHTELQHMIAKDWSRNASSVEKTMETLAAFPPSRLAMQSNVTNQRQASL